MKRAKQGKTDEQINSGNGHKNLGDPSKKVRKAMVGRIYGKNKF